MKELHQLLRDTEALTEGQSKVHNILERDGTPETKRMVKFVIAIKPNSGLYKGGNFYFLFKVSHRYPVIAPEVKCLTHIYHPNIDDAGEICLSLFEDWSSEYNCLMHCVHGLLFLLKNPNLEDPLSPYFCPEDAEDVETFHQNVRKSLQGGIIDGFRFERNIVTTEEFRNETVNKQ